MLLRRYPGADPRAVGSLTSDLELILGDGSEVL